jgi:hypothetical protein
MMLHMGGSSLESHARCQVSSGHCPPVLLPPLWRRATAHISQRRTCTATRTYTATHTHTHTLTRTYTRAGQVCSPRGAACHAFAWLCLWPGAACARAYTGTHTQIHMQAHAHLQDIVRDGGYVLARVALRARRGVMDVCRRT